MSLVMAKCTNCGANLTVDPEKEICTCEHCGTPFITQKAIINYNTTVINNNNITAQNVNIVEKDFKKIYDSALLSWESTDYEDAYNKFADALSVEPSHEETQIYKSLCVAVIKKNFIAPATTFKKILAVSTKIDISTKKYFLDVLNNMCCDESKRIYSKYAVNYRGTQQQESWTYLENELSARKSILLCAEKIYQQDPNYKKLYVTFIKNTISVYNVLTNNSICHPKQDTFNSERKKMIAKLKEIDPKAMPPKKSGCYVATCVYGSYDCPEVWTLRRYRDYDLAKKKSGRLFIKLYYAISPKLVKLFGNTKWFKNLFRKKLDKKVAKLKAMGYEDTPYTDLHW